MIVYQIVEKAVHAAPIKNVEQAVRVSKKVIAWNIEGAEKFAANENTAVADEAVS